MAQFLYDVVPHGGGGFVLVVTPAEEEAFATRQGAFDAAPELARKLRFAGHSLSIRVLATDRSQLGKAS